MDRFKAEVKKVAQAGAERTLAAHASSRSQKDRRRLAKGPWKDRTDSNLDNLSLECFKDDLTMCGDGAQWKSLERWVRGSKAQSGLRALRL